jgi:hypothetical protein
VPKKLSRVGFVVHGKMVTLTMPPERLPNACGRRIVNSVNSPNLLSTSIVPLCDVACFQGAEGLKPEIPEPAIREADYRAVWHGQKSWNYTCA